MHREPCLKLLAGYRDRHPEQAETVTRFETFVHKHPDCFERSLQVGHITGSAWVVSADGQKVLLTHHRKLNIWVQLGGHADGESDVAAVAMKEALEESGLDDLSLATGEIFDLDIHPIPARKQEPEHLHYDIRFVIQHKGKNDTYIVSEESHDLAWIEIANLQEVTTEASMLRMQSKWLGA